MAAGSERRATDLIRRHYSDYGATQTAEILASEHGLQVSRETAAEMDVGSQVVAAEAGEGEAGAWLTATQRTARRARAMGPQRARLAGRTRPTSVSDRDDRRCHQRVDGTLCRKRFDGREHAPVVDVSGTAWPAGGFLYRQSQS